MLRILIQTIILQVALASRYDGSVSVEAGKETSNKIRGFEPGRDRCF